MMIAASRCRAALPIQSKVPSMSRPFGLISQRMAERELIALREPRLPLMSPCLSRALSVARVTPGISSAVQATWSLNLCRARIWAAVISMAFPSALLTNGQEAGFPKAKALNSAEFEIGAVLMALCRPYVVKQMKWDRIETQVDLDRDDRPYQT